MNRMDKYPMEFIYTTVVTLKNGRKLYASDYGLKAFRISVRRNKKR